MENRKGKGLLQLRVAKTEFSVVLCSKSFISVESRQSSRCVGVMNTDKRNSVNINFLVSPYNDKIGL